MAEKLHQASPQSARCKLRPIYYGPCLKELGETAQESSLAYFALYPIVGSPVSAIPETIDIALSVNDLANAALEYLLSMSSCDPTTSADTVFYKAGAHVDDFLYDVRSKRLWFINFDNTLLSHQNWSGSTYLQTTFDLKGEDDLPPTNDGSELSALLESLYQLAIFPVNSAKEFGDKGAWKKVETFLSKRNENPSLAACFDFFSIYGDSSDTADYSFIDTAPLTPVTIPGTVLHTANASPTSEESKPSSLAPVIPISVSVPITALTITPSVPKYPRAPGANAPIASSIAAIASQASLALAESKANPIVVVNDLYQRLTGIPPSLKDEGRLGGSDHVPRFGCSFTFPNGETISCEGSSKQEAKSNVAMHILEAIAKGSIPKHRQ